MDGRGEKRHIKGTDGLHGEVDGRIEVVAEN